MRCSTIYKRCARVLFLISMFKDFFVENDSSVYGCPVITFHFEFDLNKKFIRETDVSDILAAKKILGAKDFVIDYKCSLVLFFL